MLSAYEVVLSAEVDKFTENTIVDRAKFIKHLKDVAKRGYAIDNEEYYEGARCVAAAVRAGGRIEAAISVTGSIFTMTMDRITRELAPLITKTADEISSKMCW